MEFEGTVLQPQFREKEKRYRATILEKDNAIGELTAKLIERSEAIAILELEIKELKEEVKGLRNRFRNFKAKVKAPDRIGKE
jgi:predicted RNase H-like nuclease (RuvC/YqgF family)